MAVCVGCGLAISGAGKLVTKQRDGGCIDCDETTGIGVKLDPAGGITCGANGLSVAAAIATSDDAAMTCCAEAKADAAAAQGTANTASASAAYRARLYGATPNQAVIDTGPATQNTPLLVQGGTYQGVTNAAGDLAIIFPNAFPNACIAMTANTGAEDFNYFVAVHDSGNGAAVSVRVWRDDGTVVASATVRLVFIAIGY